MGAKVMSQQTTVTVEKPPEQKQKTQRERKDARARKRWLKLIEEILRKEHEHWLELARTGLVREQEPTGQAVYLEVYPPPPSEIGTHREEGNDHETPEEKVDPTYDNPD